MSRDRLLVQENEPAPLPPTDKEMIVARKVVAHVRENRSWYGGKMVEPYETMAVAKMALALREALDG